MIRRPAPHDILFKMRGCLRNSKKRRHGHFVRRMSTLDVIRYSETSQVPLSSQRRTAVNGVRLMAEPQCKGYECYRQARQIHRRRPVAAVARWQASAAHQTIGEQERRMSAR